MTPVGWVISCIILSVTTLLVVQAVNMPSRKAISAQCASKARSIARAIMDYAYAWPNCAIEDPDFYVRLLGHPLNTETGALGDEPPWFTPGAKKPTRSQVYASEVKDFVCPVDKEPALNAHGYPCSYGSTSHQVHSGRSFWNAT